MVKLSLFAWSLLGVLFLVFYYTILYLVFIKKPLNTNPAELNDRLGTILWNTFTISNSNPPYVYSIFGNTPQPCWDEQSTDQTCPKGYSAVSKVYCYYPGDTISYYGKGNGLIIKKVNHYQNCQGWHGILESSLPVKNSKATSINLDN